jgi:hypothetical protein
MKLFSYVVDHDTGYAPNPADGYCTLVQCKYRPKGAVKKNIVEMAEVGDWILGTGGCGKKSAGHGTIIYLMRVDEKLSFDEYIRDGRFCKRSDVDNRDNEFALVSVSYFYYGRNAVRICDLPKEIGDLVRNNLEKKGPGYRSDLPESTIELLVDWFSRNYEYGGHGDPVAPGDRWKMITNTSTEMGNADFIARKRC